MINSSSTCDSCRSTWTIYGSGFAYLPLVELQATGSGMGPARAHLCLECAAKATGHLPSFRGWLDAQRSTWARFVEKLLAEGFVSDRRGKETIYFKSDTPSQSSES